MPTLTRRRDPDAHQEAWLIHCGDIHVGTINKRSGVPGSVDQWGWVCSFYPASHRGVHADGTASNFDEDRAAFEAAWRELLPQITATDFDEYRRYRTREVWKHGMWDAGCKIPTQTTDGRSRCFCGAEIDIAGVERHVYAAHMVEPENA